MIGQRAPVDPGIEYAQRSADLESKVAEIMRLLSRPQARAVDYAIVTANQGSITTEVDITGLSATWTAVSTRLYRVSCEAFMVTTVGTDTLSLKITNAANTQLQSHAIVGPTTASTKYGCSLIVTGLSGSQTVKVRAVRAAGTGTVTFQAGATFPAYLLVEDIGAA